MFGRIALFSLFGGRRAEADLGGAVHAIGGQQIDGGHFPTLPDEKSKTILFTVILPLDKIALKFF